MGNKVKGTKNIKNRKYYFFNDIIINDAKC